MEGPDHILSSNKEMKELVKYKKYFNKWKSLEKENNKDQKPKKV